MVRVGMVTPPFLGRTLVLGSLAVALAATTLGVVGLAAPPDPVVPDAPLASLVQAVDRAGGRAVVETHFGPLWVALVPETDLSNVLGNAIGQGTWRALARQYTSFSFADASIRRPEGTRTAGGTPGEVLGELGQHLGQLRSGAWRGMWISKIGDRAVVVAHADQAAFDRVLRDLGHSIEDPSGAQELQRVPFDALAKTHGYLMPARNDIERSFIDGVVSRLYWNTLGPARTEREVLGLRARSVLHPFLAFAVGGVLLALCGAMIARQLRWLGDLRRRYPHVPQARRRLLGLVALPGPAQQRLLETLESEESDATGRLIEDRRRERLAERRLKEEATPKPEPVVEPPPSAEEIAALIDELEERLDDPTLGSDVRKKGAGEVERARGQKSTKRAKRILTHALEQVSP